MNLAVIGSKSFNEYDLLYNKLKNINPLIIISGAKIYQFIQDAQITCLTELNNIIKDRLPVELIIYIAFLNK